MLSSIYTFVTLATAASAAVLQRDNTCTQYYTAQAGDTCTSIVQKFNYAFSVNDFIQWNPSVGGDCRTMFAGNSYCVAVKPTSCSGNIPQPTQSGTTCHCSRWYLVKGGDTCNGIEQSQGVSANDFKRLNPGVNDSCTNLIAGNWVCVAS